MANKPIENQRMLEPCANCQLTIEVEQLFRDAKLV